MFKVQSSAPSESSALISAALVSSGFSYSSVSRLWKCSRLCVGLLETQWAVVRKRSAVVVFDQCRQIGEGQISFQKYTVTLPKHPTGSFISLTCNLLTKHNRHLYHTAKIQQQVSYLFKQSVVSGFAYTDVPHHQHLDNTPKMILFRPKYQKLFYYY